MQVLDILQTNTQYLHTEKVHLHSDAPQHKQLNPLLYCIRQKNHKDLKHDGMCIFIFVIVLLIESIYNIDL